MQDTGGFDFRDALSYNGTGLYQVMVGGCTHIKLDILFGARTRSPSFGKNKKVLDGLSGLVC